MDYSSCECMLLSAHVGSLITWLDSENVAFQIKREKWIPKVRLERLLEGRALLQRESLCESYLQKNTKRKPQVVFCNQKKREILVFGYFCRGNEQSQMYFRRLVSFTVERGCMDGWAKLLLAIHDDMGPPRVKMLHWSQCHDWCSLFKKMKNLR